MEERLKLHFLVPGTSSSEELMMANQRKSFAECEVDIRAVLVILSIGIGARDMTKAMTMIEVRRNSSFQHNFTTYSTKFPKSYEVCVTQTLL